MVPIHVFGLIHELINAGFLGTSKWDRNFWDKINPSKVLAISTSKMARNL